MASAVGRVLQAINPNSHDAPIFARVFREYWRKFWRRYALAMVFMAIIAGTTAASAWIMRDVINGVFIDRDMQVMITVCIAIAVIYTARGLATYGQELVMAQVGNRIVADVQQRIFDAILKQDLAFFHRMPSSDLVTRITLNAQAVRQTLELATVSVGRDLFTLIGLIGVMVFQDIVLTLIVLVGVPVIALTVSNLMKQVRKLFNKEVHSMAEVISAVQETSQGIRVVRSFGLEDALRTQMGGAVTAVERLQNGIARVQAATAPLIDIFGGLAVASVIFYGGWQVIHAGATPGEFFAFITALVMASDPARRLARLNISLAAAAVGVRMMYALIDAEPKIVDRPDAQPLKISGGEIALKKVIFAYEAKKPILRGLTLTAPAGKTTALVGLSGSGKSTIFNMVLRFWRPARGVVEIDGQDLQAVTGASIYEQISLVSQDTFLFKGTIAENIMRGRPGATEAEMIEAAKSAAAHQFILSLARGYDTPVGELGGKLSGGQRQRIAIARAFLRDAPILLLDEPTSALDAESDAAIQAALSRLMKGRTTMIIAHRLATIVSADHICVVEAGRVIESGTHQELIAQNGAYSRLYSMQFAAA